MLSEVVHNVFRLSQYPLKWLHIMGQKCSVCFNSVIAKMIPNVFVSLTDLVENVLNYRFMLLTISSVLMVSYSKLQSDTGSLLEKVHDNRLKRLEVRIALDSRLGLSYHVKIKSPEL